ncbi:MAG: hypothetical protein AAFY64_01775 [Pseudomonadota bacterium]
MTRFAMRSSLASVAGLAAAVTFTADAAAQSMKTYKFGSAGNWRVQAITDNRGRFNHCSARVRYRSGMEVYLLAYRNGVWSIQFYRKDWPKREVSKFPVTLKIDGRTMMQTEGKFRGRSAFIQLGTSASRVRAIMRGKVMAVVSPSGTSRFRLTGTFRAAKMVARCWDKYREVSTARRNDGAFGSSGNSQGAFGVAPKPRPRSDGAFGGGTERREGRRAQERPKSGRAQLGRDKTIGLARRYLRASRRSYEILSGDENIFKNFPVNWRYENGQIGGMMVLQRSRFDADSGLQSLIRDQRKWCKGENEFQRKPTQGETGRRLAHTRGICRAPGQKTVVYDYSVAELSNRRIMMILEAVSTGRKSEARTTEGNYRSERPRRAEPRRERPQSKSDSNRWRSKGANDI